MSNYDDVARRWRNVCLGYETRFLRNDRMPAEMDHIYSYGHHFEIAALLRDAKGEPRAWLLNGDTYGNTTSRHQSVVRSALRGHGLPTVIIPHAALTQAGVEYGSLDLIDVSEDRNVTTFHETTEQPAGSVWVTHDLSDYRPRTQEELDEIIDRTHARAVQEWEHMKGWAASEVAEGNRDYWSKQLAKQPEGGPVRPTDAGLSQWDLEHGVYAVYGHETLLHTSSRTHAAEITVTPQDDGTNTYTWQTSRHWLGESVVRAATTSRHERTCKTCGGNGLRPGVLVTQPTRSQSIPWEHRCDDCRGRGTHTYTRRRWAYYLSGFDHQESTPLYFFCELPKGSKPTTVAEAYETLKPVTVQLAEQMERPVTRQGDIYAVSTPTMDTRALRKAGARIVKRGQLLATNHEATEVAYLPSGQTLARGTLYHNPGFRRPDHVRRTLAKGWHVVLKNRVPITTGRR